MDELTKHLQRDVTRRAAEHGSRFTLQPVTRGQARAIEQALITRNPGFENIRNSISPSHSWYPQAVNWGEDVIIPPFVQANSLALRLS